MNNLKNKQGFTLLEVLIYISLFSFIVGSSLTTFYQISGSNLSLDSEILKIKESEFVLNKINWLLSSADKIVEPTENSVSDKLKVMKDGELFSIFESENQIFLEENGFANSLSIGEVKINNLSFENDKKFSNSNFLSVTSSFEIEGQIFKSLKNIYEE